MYLKDIFHVPLFYCIRFLPSFILMMAIIIAINEFGLVLINELIEYFSL